VSTLAPVPVPPADTGLFGPDSVTWRVHGDVSMGLAGLRALFLQALHPLAMAGVEQHSGFRADPWGRLRRTAEYVGVTTFGSTVQAEQAAARVRAIHRKLSGIDPGSGAPFRVDHPDLLLWVHLCEAESFVVTFRRSGGRLAPGEIDRYYDEQRRAAALVGLDPASVPSCAAEVAAYFHQIRPLLRAGTAARRSAAFVLVPPMPAWVGLATPARGAWMGLAATAFGLLPRWARRCYGFPGVPTTDLAATLSARAVRCGLGALPAAWREGPHHSAARRRLAGDLAGR
jgi:uncharacterized protein (DUF2236 family)